MMDWEMGFHWVFDRGIPGLAVIFIVACMVLDSMNHQFFWDKVRNTVFFMGLVGGLGSALFIYLQYVNGTPQRVALTVVAMLSLASVLTLANWFVYGIYKLGHFDQGTRGEIKHAIDSLVKAVVGSLRGRAANIVGMVVVVITLGGCILIVPTEPPSPPQLTSFWSNTQIVAGTETARATATASPTASDTPTATSTPTPCCGLGITELPTLGTGTYVYEVPTPQPLTDADIRSLANLCVVEAKTERPDRDAACVSVVSTVFARMRSGKMSDGTVFGTITWGCRADSKSCQFPSWAARGCRGIRPEVCPDNYPEIQTHFVIVIYEYTRLLAMTQGACQGFIYYGIKSFDFGGCEIAGQGFHGKAN